ncbi:ribosomal protein S18-alanine N-acetyltransferase [Lactiplantibacillus daowaiensis]|uniref:[Ribosomal protein bS18]-alanine N-acetyltransferase n=1 Tax=Lactiplantibacillus daowaiensis TaxID=2559918 RepID=A0ABW1RZ15_9LACO|nr:ribosomal protein S18-alanine N-acetyltransferase [Lactiplantibacillus daowaiensis]
MKADWQIVEATTWTASDPVAVCYALAKAAYPTGAPWQLATFAADFALAPTHYWLIVSKQQPVGFISCSTLFDETEITNVAIDPAYQQQGLATKLLQTVCQQLTPPAKVFLEVRQSNQPAQRLYTKCGFTTLTIRRGYYQATGEDALIMRKMIN